MSNDHPHAFDFGRHVRAYVTVFVTLAALTVVTVTVASLDLGLAPAIGVALLIATIKGSLVACYFMHLLSERQLIYTVLGFTAVFFLAVLLVPVLTMVNSARV